MEKLLNQIICNYISFEFEGFRVIQGQNAYSYLYFVERGNLVLFKYDVSNNAFLVNKFIYMNAETMFGINDSHNMFLLWFNTNTDYKETTIWCSDYGQQILDDNGILKSSDE